jgi:hypothetical protein
MDKRNPSASFSVPLVKHADKPFPADVDIARTGQRYVGFFENRHGEQLIYVHDHDNEPALYHGDYEWRPVTVTMPTYTRSHGIAHWLISDELIVDDAEALWLAGCLAASGAVGGDAAEAIATQLLEDAMKAMREMPAEQREEMMRVARAEAKKRRS